MEPNKQVVNYIFYDIDTVDRVAMRGLRQLCKSQKRLGRAIVLTSIVSALYVAIQNVKIQDLQKEIEKLKASKGE